MPEDCPIELKQYIINRIQEFRDIVANIPNLKTQSEKLKAANRLSDIRNEMIAFREKYPDD
jgi:hypothetical protein